MNELHNDCGHAVCELYQALCAGFVPVTAHLEAKRIRDAILREAAAKILRFRDDCKYDTAESQYWIMQGCADLINPDKLDKP